MFRKYDPITGVLVYEVDPLPVKEISTEEITEWKTAHHMKGAAANSCVRKILENMYPSESFAEASARLGYGNTGDEETQLYYYNRGILIVDERCYTADPNTCDL